MVENSNGFFNDGHWFIGKHCRSKGMKKYAAVDKWNTQLRSLYQTIGNRVYWEWSLTYCLWPHSVPVFCYYVIAELRSNFFTRLRSKCLMSWELTWLWALWFRCLGLRNYKLVKWQLHSKVFWSLNTPLYNNGENRSFITLCWLS